MSAPVTEHAPSLQRRLVQLLVGLVAVIWLLAAISTWVDAQHELDELLDGHLAQTAALLMVQADEQDDERAHDAPSLHKYAPRVAFQVFVEGRLVTHSSNAGDQPLSQERDGFSTVRLSTGTWRVFAAQDPRHEVMVFVGEDMDSRQSILWAVMRSTVLPLLLALPFLALAVWWSVRRGLAPVRALQEALTKRQPSALEPVPHADLPSELQPLVQALNALLARIGSMVEAERRFTADAAHELRTPIAGIRTQAQVALGATDDAERSHALHATLAGCDRAARLVEQLLTLSRLEAAPDGTATTVDLSAVARRVLGDLAPAALARGQVLELEAPAPCPVAANEVLLGVLVRNLCDNALRYSPDGAQVLLQVTQDAAGATLRVQDSGAGLSPEQIERLGERFYRVLGTGQAGSGLGWSIVRRLVQVMGAQVAVDRSPDLGGLRVTVRW